MALNVLLVGLGGFVGSALRYLVSVLVKAQTTVPFPFATLVVNIVGCFAIGALAAFVQKQGTPSTHLILFCSVGVIGGFTTFSAFGLETLALAQNHQWALAGVNVLANLVLGLAAVYFGRLAI